MKVTVCFGSIRVVVPCGTGNLLVRDLVQEAIRRYKKAAGKDPDSWIVVHHLQSQSGILDPDDKVSDVADDREQILVSFDDSGPDPCLAQGGGDGASGSSVGTGSPDIFQNSNEQKYSADDSPHIEVTSTNTPPSSGLGLQVRRSSDPSLNQIATSTNNPLLDNVLQNEKTNKRWSAAPACRNDLDSTLERIPTVSERRTMYLSPSWENELEESQHDVERNPFTRAGRLSMQFLDGNGNKWLDAAEKIATQSYSSKSLPREIKRKEPLGQAYESIREKDGEMLLIMNEKGGPLGLTAVPDIHNGGLLVQNVEGGSRAEAGRLRPGDRIVEINGTKLVGLSEGYVQDHLKRSLALSELRLRVLRANSSGRRYQRNGKIAEMVEAEEKPSSTKVATVSPTRKMPGAPVNLQTANTRKLGKKIEIILRKGHHGLGFSVTTRDNPAGGQAPIYIKKILPRGAAIEDGRLKPGDRLLEVDGISMSGKTQDDVVGILRATQPGSAVKIVVSRQKELAELEEKNSSTEKEVEKDNTTPPKPPPPILPNSPIYKLIKSKSSLDMKKPSHDEHFVEAGTETSLNEHSNTFPWKNREILTLHIPVHDSEKAGLGVSVKGKTGSSSSFNSNSSNKVDGDLGIFVKSVIHGGAASRDGRLKMNDQLLNVNGISLLGQSNAEAMETLRRAMLQTSSKYPGMITLSVARKINRPSSIYVDQSDNSNNSNSNTSEQSGKTVIYLNPEKRENYKEPPALNQRQQNEIYGTHRVNQNYFDQNNTRWNNPVLDRLTGGMGNAIYSVIPPNRNIDNRQQQKTSLAAHGLRNESYYMATQEAWSPKINVNNHGNNSVLIEEDIEPQSPLMIHHRQSIDSTISKNGIPSSPNCDVAYDSQLSLNTNGSATEVFARDGIGRRSMSEKHHAALDARETGTYQRNKKLREERDRQKQIGNAAGSMESLKNIGHRGKYQTVDLRGEAKDKVGALGPSLGLRKSSSLESLQTMVQEIQMSDEPRGPNTLRAPRGKGNEDSLRAAVTRQDKPKKTWLLEDGNGDGEGGFTSRNGPLQSSLNDGKNKNRPKKQGLFKGIGHMFRFGKHRKDGVAPMATYSEIGPKLNDPPNPIQLKPQPATVSAAHMNGGANRKIIGPPQYQPPPPFDPNHPPNELFNHRYAQYANYEDLQQQMSPNVTNTTSNTSGNSDQLSDSTIEQMRQQVMQQRVKVEEESRRHQHYHSQRSTRTLDGGSNQRSNYHRPVSTFYEYETVHVSGRKMSAPSPPKQWITAQPQRINENGGSGSMRTRGPFVTQVTIRNQTQVTANVMNGQQPTQSASKV